MSESALQTQEVFNRPPLGREPDVVRSLRHTAAILGVSLAHLRRLIVANEIKTTRLGPRRVGIRDSHREAFLNR
jgi:hypothetical protein